MKVDAKCLFYSIAFLCCIAVLFINIHLNVFNVQKYLYAWSDDNPFYFGKSKERDLCVLANVDPWDSVVMPYLRPDEDPLKNCRHTEMHTYLINGRLYVSNESKSSCFYRCLINKGETSYRTEQWVTMLKNESYPIYCDFVETHCTEDGKTTFRYIHVQVVESENKTFQKEDELNPSVIVLLLDSVSSSTGMRAIMETVQILRQYYDATIFYHHNKVGLNSRPNAFAIFAGNRISRLDSLKFGARSDPDLTDSCRAGLKRNNTISYDFFDQRYATLHAEDWVSALTWPNCIGFGNEVPVDHYSGGRINRLDEESFGGYKNYYGCQRSYHLLLNYSDQFLVKYDGIAKFAVIWLSKISHDSVNDLYHMDKYFANFFRRHINTLRNSFVFLMGDHGMRFGSIRNTKIGFIEDNNPLLMITLPKYLRSNRQLVSNVILNARRHTSQYDFFATLYDIAHIAKRQNFRSWNEYDFRKELGTERGSRMKSLLRPIIVDRTCTEMEINEDFCLCIRNWTSINVHSFTVLKAAQKTVKHINDRLRDRKYSELCSKVQLKANTKITKIARTFHAKASVLFLYAEHRFSRLIGLVQMACSSFPSFSQRTHLFDKLLCGLEVKKAEMLQNESVMRLKIMTRPGDALFETQMRMEKNGNLTFVTEVYRISEYERQAHCVSNHEVRPFCYCRNKLSKIRRKNYREQRNNIKRQMRKPSSELTFL